MPFIRSYASGGGGGGAADGLGASSTGTANTVAKFTSSTVIGNSQITDNGTAVGIVSAGALTLTPGAASTWKTSAGALTVDSAAALNLGSTDATSIAVGKSGITTTITGGLTQLTGAVSLTGNGASSFTTSSGALTLTAAAASTWSTSAGALTLTSAAAATWSTAAGALTVDSAAALNLGTANGTSVSVSRSGVATTINGSLTVSQATTFNGSASFAAAQTLTVGAAESFGATPTTLVTIQNTTAATSGNQKYSPSLLFGGCGWGTTGGASQTVTADLYLRPVQGTVADTELVCRLQKGGGSLTEIARFTTSGTVTSGRPALQFLDSSTPDIIASGTNAGNDFMRLISTNGTSKAVVYLDGASSAVQIQLGNTPTTYYQADASTWKPVVDNNNDLGATSQRWRQIFMSGYMELTEMTAPSAPASNKARFYCEDNGAGKTRIVALFPTGAAQVIATEP